MKPRPGFPLSFSPQGGYFLPIMSIRIDAVRGIEEIPREEWNALVDDAAIPFLEWEWLAALEGSGSISPDTGWHPLHLTLRKGAKLIAAAPFYIKTHSMGEFVFDHLWAEAAASLKRPYYPKLVGVVPATPAEGYRFLISPEADPDSATAVILETAEDICRKNKISSLHLLFADPSWAAGLSGLGYTAWKHHHYLWENPGFGGFEDYLSLFSKNQRKNVRKEYRRAGEQGIDLRIVPGSGAEEDFYSRMFDLYTLTNDKFIPWDARFVNRDFFLRLRELPRDRLYFVEARLRGSEEPLALALLIRKDKRIWGRYWGAYEEVRDLHFSACYYAPMDWAVSEGIRTFDPGAGSPHKIRRGFRAVENFSYHKFFDPLMDRIFTGNIAKVNGYEQAAIDELNAELPFKVPSPDRS